MAEYPSSDNFDLSSKITLAIETMMALFTSDIPRMRELVEKSQLSIPSLQVVFDYLIRQHRIEAMEIVLDKYAPQIACGVLSEWLCQAAHFNHTDCAQLFVRFGADPQHNHSKALQWSALNHNRVLFDFLVGQCDPRQALAALQQTDHPPHAYVWLQQHIFVVEEHAALTHGVAGSTPQTPSTAPKKI